MNDLCVDILWSLKGFIYPSVYISTDVIKANFRNKQVIITGATKGIGRVLAQKLMPAQARLVLIARDEKELSELCNNALSVGCDAVYYAVDFRDREALSHLCDELRSTISEADYLFCNAGKSICRSISDAQDRLHDYDRTMDVNYRSLVALSLALLPALTRARGRIVYTSSVSTLYPAVKRWSAYHASKSAANVWCKTAASELKSKGIKVKIAYMPLVRTAMSDANPGYKGLPAYWPADAAAILLRLAVSRRSSYMPWWARVSYKLANLFA